MAPFLSAKALRKRGKKVIDAAYIQANPKRTTRLKLQSTNTTTTELNHLPVEILSAILSRLPLTSILQAKLTCKLWQTTMDNNPTFPDLHLTHALNHPGYLYSLVHDDSNLYYADNQPPRTTLVGVKLHGGLGAVSPDLCTSFASCRGLVCFRILAEGSICICNPVIREHVIIPTPTADVRDVWGFGYAPLTKKYKFIHYSYKLPNGPVRGITPKAAILTLGDEVWRELPLPFAPIGSPLHCHGVIYWIMASLYKISESEHHVVSVNLDTETSRASRVLSTNYDTARIFLHLAELDETVALMVSSRFRFVYEVWMLMDQEEDIWVKKYTIDVSAVTYRLESGGFITFLGLWMNKDWYGMHQVKKKRFPEMRHSLRNPLQVTSRHYFSFNAKRKTFATVQLPFAKADGISPLFLIAHVGSLISPLKIVATAKYSS